jgi:BirA family biotin operon repressor/biotin-[acetyl-CoA-carboxylase] ligase
MNTYLFDFYKSKDLNFMKKEYESLCVNISGDIRIESKNEGYIGTGMGITETGLLIVEKENGEQVEVNSGEVSVRGIYGYI